MSIAPLNYQELQASSALLRSQAASGLTEDMAVRAAKAAKQVDLLVDFAATTALNFLDKFFEGHEPFAPKLLHIQVTYRAYVWITYALGLAIASYGEDFDNKVVKLCADKSLTVQQRRERIGQFIKDADGIHTLSKGIMTKLNDLKSDLTDFIASFEAWVNKIVQGWNAMIKEVQRELEDAMRDIERIRAAAAAAMGLPYYYATSTELDGASGKIGSGRSYVDDPVEAIDALGKLWQAISNDSLAIDLWLKDGAEDADMPEYMKLSLEYAARRYADMAVPLRKYAQVLTEQDIPKAN